MLQSKELKKLVLLLVILAACLFGYVLHDQDGIFRKFQSVLLSIEWVLLTCITVWCSYFIFLTFSWSDLPLIGLLLISIAEYFIGYAKQSVDAVILLASVTLGKSAFVLLRRDEGGATLVTFLVDLVLLLAFASWWHLDMSSSFYHGPRWMGLWDNPNDYGMLMGAGVVLAIGLRAGMKKEERRMQNSWEKRNAESKENGNILLRSLRFIAAIKSAIGNWQSAILLVTAGMMAVGLIFSYSRGAWVGTVVGLLYLAWSYGKLKWQYVLLGIFVITAVVFFFWHSTADTDAWYLKRLDLSRPSAQHRVSAWRGALQMMRDHPLGVGWNNAVGVYDKNYSPPENGAAALTMNSYFMVGTELGLPGLICFISYVALCLRTPKIKVQNPKPEDGTPLGIEHRTLDTTQVTCRAGAVVLLAAFWFDGGLFTLATASVFWILLELGAVIPNPS